MRRMSSLPKRDLRKLSAYLDGELTPQEANAVEQLVKENADLKWAFDEMRRTRKLVQALPELQAPRNFTLSREMADARAFRPAPFLRYATAIAMLAFAFTLGTDFLMNMARGMRAAEPAMEVMSDFAAKEAESVGEVIEEAAPMAMEEEAVPGEQMDMMAETAVDELPQEEMEAPVEAEMPEMEVPEPSAAEEEIAAMEIPAEEDQAAGGVGADVERSAENLGDEWIEGESGTSAEGVEEPEESYFESQAANAADESAGTHDLEGAAELESEEASAAMEETPIQEESAFDFLQNLSLLRILEIFTGLTALILGLVWLRQRKQ
jgi:anti-sigma factor RsiW